MDAEICGDPRHARSWNARTVSSLSTEVWTSRDIHALRAERVRGLAQKEETKNPNSVRKVKPAIAVEVDKKLVRSV